MLEPGEYIIKVQGKHKDTIIQLYFMTNKGIYSIGSTRMNVELATGCGRSS